MNIEEFIKKYEIAATPKNLSVLNSLLDEDRLTIREYIIESLTHIQISKHNFATDVTISRMSHNPDKSAQHKFRLYREFAINEIVGEFEDKFSVV